MKQSEKNELASIPQERSHLNFMLAKNPNYFGNIPGSSLKPVHPITNNTEWEGLTCVGYSPASGNMEATFSLKRPTGYSGDLCTNGSFIFVRFYFDFGAGFIDQGVVGVNVHDIPGAADCQGDPIFPIMYVATLQRNSIYFAECENPELPVLRAILSWGVLPPAASPAWLPIFGNVLDAKVQLAPFRQIIYKPGIDLSKYLNLAASSPVLTAKQIGELSGVDINQLLPVPPVVTIQDLAKKYAKEKVPVSRTAFKLVHSIVDAPLSESASVNKSVLEGLKIDYANLIDQISVSGPYENGEADVSYEQLECIGLDYNTQSLVATLVIKQQYGYEGDLCTAGSTEFVALWIDWDNSCSWEYLGVLKINVHDIVRPAGNLSYSASLPLDTASFMKICEDPNIVRVRGVLSWNVPPSTTDPDQLQFYGNMLNAHVQIKPGISLQNGPVPTFYTIGGIDVENIDGSGLTTSGSSFAFNGLPVPAGAPFGGTIVITGPQFYGYRYRISVTDQVNGSSYYLNNNFYVEDIYGNAVLQFATGGYYSFLKFAQNPLGVLAQFPSGISDLVTIEMDFIDSAGNPVSTPCSNTVQFNNTAPSIALQVNDNGDCKHYHQGDTITGNFYVNSPYLDIWSLTNTWSASLSGNINTPAMPGTPYSIQTGSAAYPCGEIVLSAWDKTIVNSVSNGGPDNVGLLSQPSYIICLQ